MAAIPPDLVEAKDHYELELQIRDNLETKSNNITTVSGTVATLLFGFGQFLIEKLTQLQYDYLGVITGLLFLGVLSGAVAIFLSVWGFRIQKYSYVIGTKNIERDNLKTFTLNDGTTIDLSKGNRDDDDRIKAYIKSIKTNSSKNDSKRSIIQKAQWAFFVSVSTIPVLIGWLLVHPIKFPTS